MSDEPSRSPRSSAALDPLLGRVIDGRYKVLDQIGSGGMGRVYRALQAPLDRLVALKILGAGYDSDPAFYKRFFLEASVTATLTHPNTIRVYDFGRTRDGVFFIAMELLNGRTLSEAMRREGPFGQDRIVHIAQQICRSLREAHALGIIHRDLKPANVMLLQQHDDHDFAKVLDFGLVKFFAGEAPQGTITNHGTFVGSPHYIAPEQARNQSPDQRCDIYSLGVVLYQMLTGDVPFTAQAPVDIIVKHVVEPPVPPRELRPDLNIAPELQQVVLKCLAKPRESRYQSMDELLAELKIVRRLLGGVTGPEPTAPSAGMAAQTPPTPHPDLCTPSQPMPTLPLTAPLFEDPPGPQPSLTGWIAKRKSSPQSIFPAMLGDLTVAITMDWLAEFRALHERARAGGLSALEVSRYDRERKLISDVLLTAQRLPQKPGDLARQSLRLARDLPVDLQLGGRSEKTRLFDLAVRGFAAPLDHPPRVGQHVGFTLKLRTSGSLSGHARVVNLQRKRGVYRVGFAFEALPPVDATRINFEVFDGILSALQAA